VKGFTQGTIADVLHSYIHRHAGDGPAGLLIVTVLQELASDFGLTSEDMNAAQERAIIAGRQEDPSKPKLKIVGQLPEGLEEEKA